MMPSSVSSGCAGANSPTAIQSGPAVCESGLPPTHSVGALLPDPTREAEDELDEAIDTLRTMAALAQDRGDIETAFEFTRRMLAASKGRTDEHKDRLAREHLAMVERSLDEGCDYFQVEGDKARAELERRAA